MAQRQLIRLVESRKSDLFDDQKTAAQIALAEASSENQQEFLNYVLSQIKRIIHGNETGRWFDDPVSAPEIQHDLLDNNIEQMTVGDKTKERMVIMTYSFELPIADRAITGMFVFNHDGTNVDLENAYNFIPPLISGVTFSGVIVGDDIRLEIETNGIGENPTIRYRKTSVNIAT